jgi:serpin B
MKRLLMIAALAAAPLAFAACNHPAIVPDEEQENKPAQAITLTRAEAGINAGSNAFGLNVFRTINASDKVGDLFISPLSLSLALAMTSAGADGNTEAQMRSVLGFGDATNAEMAEYFRKMTEALLNLDPKTTLQIANAIWTDKGITLKKGFVSDVTKYYHSEANSADMSATATIDAINRWCSEHTNGKIPKILDYDSRGLAVLLVNALYFNGIWKTQFTDTFEGKFKALDGKGVSTPMMRATRDIPYASDGKWEMVQLAYGNGGFVMDLLLPVDEKGFEKGVCSLDADEWNALTGTLRSREVHLEMPKFKMNYEIVLNDVLQALGMTDAFTGAANFSKMSDAGMCIDFVKQLTYVDVNEKGTEAAAVTAIGMKTTSIGPSHTVYFIADRPFVFAIREVSTGAILFIGQKTK